MSKQSSVEWLIDQLEQKGDTWENVSIRSLQISIDISDYFELKKQAKAMHKEEIEEAWNDGCYQSSDFPKTSDAEQYYNETFNQ
jgi:hypothetical protein